MKEFKFIKFKSLLKYHKCVCTGAPSGCYAHALSQCNFDRGENHANVAGVIKTQFQPRTHAQHHTTPQHNNIIEPLSYQAEPTSQLCLHQALCNASGPARDLSLLLSPLVSCTCICTPAVRSQHVWK